MRTTRRLLLLLLLLLPCCAALADSPCAALRGAWQRKIDLKYPSRPQIIERNVRAGGEALTVEVWGAGGAERAAAAAQLALLHEALGYRARLRGERADLCAMTRAAHDGGLQRLAVVAAAARWASDGCGATVAWALDELTSLTLGAGAAVPATPVLLAHAPTAPCAALAAALFYADADDAALLSCGFRSSDGRFAVLARSGDDYDARVLAALRTRSAAPQLAVTNFPTDPDFRQYMSQLRQRNASFLFVDDDIWDGEPRVVRVPPPPSARAAGAPRLERAAAMRVGNGHFMQNYAPKIAKLVTALVFAPADLRDILARETAQRRPTPNVTEAACGWALHRIDSLFDTLNSKGKDARAATYSVAVRLCDDDPDVAAHKAAAEVVRRTLWNATSADVRYSFRGVNCSNEEALRDAVAEHARERRTVALVAWSAAPGARAAAAAAARALLPLLLVGAAPAPAAAARAPSGRLADLACAYRHLLGACEWSRLAVLSDRSAYSASFAEALLAGTALVHRRVTVDAQSVPAALSELLAADARVVLVNAGWAVAAAVVCGAARRGMRADYVWLVREWRGAPCAGGAAWAGVRVVSLGVSWRGGSARGGSANLRASLREAWRNDSLDGLGPPHTAALADALIQITLAFDTFWRECPSNRYDLRGSFSYLSKYLDETNATGVAGNLETEDYALKDPVVFVYDWSAGDGRGRAAAVWRVVHGAVQQHWPAGAVRCAALPAGARVPDRPDCRTAGAGDAFAPRCLDAPLFASAAYLLLGALALGAARRARLAARRRRELAWRRREDERRRRVASQLASFLVDRAAVTLLHEIGAGSYGRVHFAELRRADGGALLVAAKEPHADAAPAEESEFLREACVLAPLSHAHVVRLVGVCVTGGPPLVLMEHALFLDLRRYLTERRGAAGAAGAATCAELAPRELTRLAREAAAALQYLAARRVVHRDVRAANCLVDARRALKLADFGMARALGAAEPEYASTRRGLFPVLWMAPESLARGVFSPASDVWALGVLLLELATLGARPFGGWAPARVLRFVAAGGRAPLPPDLAPDTREVVLSCWQRAPERRPSADSVRRVLTERPCAVRAALLPPQLPPPPPSPRPPPRAPPRAPATLALAPSTNRTGTEDPLHSMTLK